MKGIADFVGTIKQNRLMSADESSRHTPARPPVRVSARLAELTSPDSALMRFAEQSLKANKATTARWAELTAPNSAMVRFAEQSLKANEASAARWAELTAPNSAMVRMVEQSLSAITSRYVDMNLGPLMDKMATMDLNSVLSNAGERTAQASSKSQDELDTLFAELPEGEALLAEASDALELLISFDHNQTVRTVLQLSVVASILATLFVAYSFNPWAAMLSAFGTPSAIASWKFIGGAYDRLYGAKDYHPNKTLGKGHAPPRTKPHSPTAS